MQRLTCLLCSAVMVPVCVPVAVPDFVDGAGEGDGDRLRVRLGFGVVDVPVVVGVAVTDGNASGSHDAPLAVVAVPAAAVPAAMARVTPEAAVARTVPAIRVTVAGRACAKRMKRPTCAARYCCGTTRSVWGVAS